MQVMPLSSPPSRSIASPMRLQFARPSQVRGMPASFVSSIRMESVSAGVHLSQVSLFSTVRRCYGLVRGHVCCCTDRDESRSEGEVHLRLAWRTARMRSTPVPSTRIVSTEDKTFRSFCLGRLLGNTDIGYMTARIRCLYLR